MVKEVSSAGEFDAELNAAGSKLVVVDFHAVCEYVTPQSSKATNCMLMRVHLPPFANARVWSMQGYRTCLSATCISGMSLLSHISRALKQQVTFEIVNSHVSRVFCRRV